MVKGERFNSISHLVGATLALAGAVVLIVVASNDGGARRIVAFSVYGTSLFLLYLISTLYHGLPGRAKHVFRILDHQAIYLLIAGSYTPFTLVTLHGAVGWWLFGAVWGMAVLGMVLDALPRRGTRVLPYIIYLVMGWIIVVALKPLLAVFCTPVASCFTHSIIVIRGCMGCGICSCWPAASVITWRSWSMSEDSHRVLSLN